MKHFVRLFLLAAATVFTACSDSTIIPGAPEFDDGSRGIVPVATSETNPTLLTDWENCSTIYLNETNGGERLRVTAPWGIGVSTALDSAFIHDIKKADGWTMLFHTFTGFNEDSSQAYMCFYNWFSGYVKVFYYANKSDVATNSVWSISSHGNNTPRAIFSDSEYFSQPLAGDNNYTIWSITADNRTTSRLSGIRHGWNGFEFRIGEYSPLNSEGEFLIDAYNITYTKFNFNGTETSKTTGTITTLNAGSSSPLDNPLAKATINYTGEQAKNAVDSVASKFLNKSFIGINFKNIIAKVSVGDYVGAITSGLGSIFKSLIKPKPTVSEVKLQTQGTITLNGNAETPTVSNVNDLVFPMKDILECERSASNKYTDYAKLSAATNSNIELGIWNLQKKPTLYYERYTKFANELSIPEDHNGGAIDFHGMLDYPQTHVGDIEVIFNPAIAMYIKSYSVTASVIDVVGGNRSINNKGKLEIAYNRDNEIISTNGITTYGVDYLNRDLFLMVDGLLDKVSINNDTQLYIDWGDNVGGNRAAVINLTMNVDYNGNVFSYTESRVYDVVYASTTNGRPVSYFNNPPSSYILNQAGNAVYSSNLYSY